MDITENKLQQIIVEELKEVLGMDQEYAGSDMDVDAENDLSGALVSLKAAGYTREEVLGMVDNAYGDGEPYRKPEEELEENCGCSSCPEHGSSAKIRVKFR